MSGRTGAKSAPVADRGPRRATYRGVRWRWDDAGVGWYNDDAERWVRWVPGGDGPPPPPPWESAGLPTPPPRVARAGWRSPYRLVPIVLVVAVVIIGVVQATSRTAHPVAAERASAEKLAGKCLPTKGTSHGHPVYGSSAVSCDLPVASVKVVDVLPGTPGSRPCPSATTAVQLAYPGVRYPHVECVRPVGST